ncbi:MAG: HD domain-containing protein [Treponema sp.]|nr:HD domain-containing protein [Candidatus Treponema equifaecale]
MSITDEEFFAENVLKINKLILQLLLLANLVPVALIVLSVAGIFSVKIYESLAVLSATLVFAGIEYILVNKLKNKKPAVYFGLFALEFFIAAIGSHNHIGIYIAYGIVPILASLYYNKKLTTRVTLLSYAFTLISLYLKYKNDAAIFDNMAHNLSLLASYVPIVAGFTIEYFFVFLIARMLTRRNFFILTRLMSSIDDRNAFLSNLRDTKTKLETKNKELEETQFKIIQFVAECLGSHDLFTGRHVIHTKEYVSIICKKLREAGWYVGILNDETISLYTSAAFLHDIGKIHIPEGILNKPGKFTDEEFERMKSHPEEGRKLLEFLPQIGDGEFNQIAIQMAYCHHEKWNGTGYPRRISGDTIPLCARIMAAADVLDALISQRLYKEPMSLDAAMKVFEESKGTHFEPCIADAVIACREEIEKIDKEFKKEETAENNEELQWWYRYHNIQKN